MRWACGRWAVVRLTYGSGSCCHTICYIRRPHRCLVHRGWLGDTGRHLQQADSFRCPKWFDSVCLGRTVDTKNEACPAGCGGQPNGPTHLLPTTPACKSRRRRHGAQRKILACTTVAARNFEGARWPMFPADRSRRMAPANVSRWCWQPINLVGARAFMDIKNPLPSAAAKTFPLAASNGAHRLQQVGHAQGSSPSPLPRGR
jgi:hypothetical protein